MLAPSAVITFVLCLVPDVAWAWGPVTHLVHGARILEEGTNLPEALQQLLQGFRWAYLYGCVGADMIQIKRYSGSIYTHCHNWRIGWKVLHQARSPEQQAFAYGYLSHLAADVYSHNYFLPIQLIASFPSRTHRHVYWEARFDAQLGTVNRRLLRDVILRRPLDCDELVERVVERTLFSFRTHKRIFRAFVALQHLERWQEVLRHFTARSRFRLPDREIERYNRLCVESIRDLLEHGEQAIALHHDPNGHESLEQARQVRRKLRTLRRRGVAIEELRRRYVDLFTGARNTGEVPEVS
ncbi:MAG: zinc dependent phospholipase C family protein [Candidatus Binatia bacterium]